MGTPRCVERKAGGPSVYGYVVQGYDGTQLQRWERKAGGPSVYAYVVQGMMGLSGGITVMVERSRLKRRSHWLTSMSVVEKPDGNKRFVIADSMPSS